MAQKSTRPANKRAHDKYKLNNQVEKNKITKLTKHCAQFPKDAQSAERLEGIKKKGYAYKRARPINPGSNPTVPNVKQTVTVTVTGPKTAREQVCIMLGLRLPPENVKARKPKITKKRRKKI